MGLIIKDKIKAMIPGYPTVSDKYNVAGGILAGSAAVKFGELVQYSSTTGYYTKATSVSNIGDVAGFVLATNVKLNTVFPEGGIEVAVGEAFNLLLNGYVAVELDSGATASYIAAGKKVCVILSTGKITTADKYSSGTIEYLPDAAFTGMYENQGTSASPKYVAELCIK